MSGSSCRYDEHCFPWDVHDESCWRPRGTGFLDPSRRACHFQGGTSRARLEAAHHQRLRNFSLRLPRARCIQRSRLDQGGAWTRLSLDRTRSRADALVPRDTPCRAVGTANPERRFAARAAAAGGSRDRTRGGRARDRRPPGGPRRIDLSQRRTRRGQDAPGDGDGARRRGMRSFRRLGALRRRRNPA